MREGVKGFVTGIAGFVGTHLAMRLVREGHEVSGIDLPIPETDAWKALWDDKVVPVTHGWVEHDATVQVIEKAHPDVVVHLAARAIVEDGFRNPIPTFLTDVMGTLYVLEACRKLNLPVLVATTDKVYGTAGPPYFEDTPFLPFTPYDTSKAAADLLCNCYSKSYKLPVITVRSCNIYGPGDLHWSRLVPGSFQALARNERPVLYTSMQNVRREWVHVDDEVEAIMLLTRKLLDGAPSARGAYNIGTGDVLTNRTMMNKIIGVTGKKVTPILAEKDFPEIGDQWLNHNRLDDIGWSPKVPLNDGLKRTWEWYSGYVGGRDARSTLEDAQRKGLHHL